MQGLQAKIVSALLVVLLWFGVAADAWSAKRWVTAWYASPQARWDGNFPLPTKLPAGLWNQTVRQRVRVAVDGARLRVVLTNVYGDTPLVVGAADLAIAGQGPDGLAGSDRILTFSGRTTVSIPAGAAWVSDPVAMPTRAGDHVLLSLYLPQPTAPATFHWEGLEDAWIADGNAAAATRFRFSARAPVRLFVSAVQVEADSPKLIVAFGDSITDGNASTPGEERRWPDFLSRALGDRGIAVVNGGISGARLLAGGMGESALARLDRDVLAQPGVNTVVVLMGINDIAWPGTPFAPDAPMVDADTLIAGYRQLIARAHGSGVRIVGATLTPFEGALEGTPITGYYTVAKDRLRRTVNHWIRDSGEFDAVVDFDALLRDPARPSRMLQRYDSGDHLHPGDVGYEAMARAVGERLSIAGASAFRTSSNSAGD